MAIEQLQALGIESGKDKVDLSMLVTEATWKDILIELVKNNELDPWNIDIVEIVNKYIEAVKSFKVMDLRIPANIILAAAVLLRLKSDMLSLFAPEEEMQELEEGFVRPSVVVDELTVRLKPPMKRKIALVELIHALEEAMKIKEGKATQKLLNNVIMPIKFDDIDIEKEIEILHGEIEKRVDKKNMTTFSYLSKEINFKDNVITGLFIPLLFLTNKGKIQLMQEEFFGEIIIQLVR